MSHGDLGNVFFVMSRDGYRSCPSLLGDASGAGGVPCGTRGSKQLSRVVRAVGRVAGVSLSTAGGRTTITSGAYTQTCPCRNEGSMGVPHTGTCTLPILINPERWETLEIKRSLLFSGDSSIHWHLILRT